VERSTNQSKLCVYIVNWSTCYSYALYFSTVQSDLCVVLLQYGQVNQSQLAEACFVVNVLDVKVKKDLLHWFVRLQLAEYPVLFGEEQEVSPPPLYMLLSSPRV